jgi:hypothetical protein
MLAFFYFSNLFNKNLVVILFCNAIVSDAPGFRASLVMHIWRFTIHHHVHANGGVFSCARLLNCVS